MEVTTTTANVPALNPQGLQEIIRSNLPKMQEKQGMALSLLSEITQVTTDEEAEDVTARLAAIRDVHGFIQKKRMEITRQLDELKDQLMECERPLDPKAGTKSLYNEKKKILEDFQQAKHDRINAEKAEAARRKEQENEKVDLKARILERLNQMILAGVTKVDNGSKDYFAASTIETFDERAETYKSTKPKLKQTDYDACFASLEARLITPDELKGLIDSVRSEQPYEQWNAKFVEAVSPVINAWRAKISDLKANLIELTRLRQQDEAAAKELETKQKAEEERQAQARKEQLERETAEQQKKVQEQAELDKLSNSFAEQAATQTLEDAGRTKLVFKFTDPKEAPKGFLQIVYEVMATPEFQSEYPVFQKRDKSKKLMFDDKKRPVYIDPAQWWIDQWVKYCDGNIPGAQLYEDSKVTIRK